MLDLEPRSVRTSRAPITLKLELLQHTGSFKPRGAFSAMLAADVPPAGVVAASGGNFALAVAHAAGELGHRATIFVPEASPPAKVERLRRTAAEVVVTGAFYDDALAAAASTRPASGALELHAFDDPLVVAGQGTCGRELDRERPGLDTIVVAVGGGGLCGGRRGLVRGSRPRIAVEPERCADPRRGRSRPASRSRSRSAASPPTRSARGGSARSRGRLSEPLGRRVGAGRRRGDPRRAAPALVREADRRRARRRGGPRRPALRRLRARPASGSGCSSAGATSTRPARVTTRRLRETDQMR